MGKINRVLMALGLVLTVPMAQAAEFINFGGGSLHFERDLGHNEFNPGIGYERDYNDEISWALGYYKNSLSKPTFYGVVNYLPYRLSDSWRAGLTGGLLTGYNNSDIVPLLAPSIEWRGSRIGLQFFLVPTVKPYVDGAVVGQLKIRFR